MKIAAATIALAMTLVCHVSFGANADWNAGTSNWDTPANWTGGTGTGGRPGAADIARILNGGTAQITGVLTNPSVDGVRVESVGGSHVVQSVGSLTAAGGGIYIAETNGQSGSYTLNSGSLSTSGELWVGQNGNATFTQNGGNVSTTGGGWLHVARGGTSTSTYNMNGGTIVANTNMGVGEAGNGTFNMAGGSLSVLNGTLYAPAGGTGTINQSGGTISVQEIRIGDGGAASGTYNQTGGTLNVGNNNGWFHLARQGNATYNLSGNGVISMSGNGHFSLGEFGSGTLNITGSSAQVNLGSSTVFDFRAAPDTLRFRLDNGGASKITTAGTFTNFQGNLDVDIAAGAALLSSSSHVLVSSTVNTFTDSSVFSEALWDKSNPGGNSVVATLKPSSQVTGSPITATPISQVAQFSPVNQGWAQITGLTPGIPIDVLLDINTNATLGNLIAFMNANGQNASLAPGNGPFELDLRFLPTGANAFFAFDFSDFDAIGGTTTNVQGIRALQTPEPGSIALWTVMGLAGSWYVALQVKRGTRRKRQAIA